MGCSSTKESVVLKIGDRDFPRDLVTSLCFDSEVAISKLVLSMRAAGFLGTLLQQLPNPQQQQQQLLQHYPQTVHSRRVSAESTQTVFMSDGNHYEIQPETVRTADHLRRVLAGIPELMVYHSSGRTLLDFLDLSPFTSASGLCLVDVPIHLVHYLKTLRPHLVRLSMHRCTDSAKKVFETCGGDQSFPALWTRLEVVDLRWNSLTSLDDTFKLLPCLHTLDLSNNRLSDVSGLKFLTGLQVLNLSYNCMSRVPVLMEESQNCLRVLLMRFNRISSLRNIEHYQLLTSFDISNNIVCDHNELRYLKGTRTLTKLCVAHNPFENIQKVSRKDMLRHINHLVPIGFILDGRPLNDKENLALRKMRVARMTPSLTPVSTTVEPALQNNFSALDETAITARFEASVDSRRGGLVDTGGSEADISSSDAEGYLTNSLSARARATRNHLDKVRGRYGSNWLVNWNRSEMGRSIPSPPPNLLEPVPSVSTDLSPLAQGEVAPPREESKESAEKGETKEEKADNEEEAVVGELITEDPIQPSFLESSKVSSKTEVEEEVVLTLVEQCSSSQLYVTAPSELDSSRFASSYSSSQFGTGRSGSVGPAPEVYSTRWEPEEEPADAGDVDVQGQHFLVTPILPSGRGEKRMLVIGASFCLQCCLQSGRVLDRSELRLLTSVRREQDGVTLALTFRTADPSHRSRRFRFANADECERCRSDAAGHLLLYEGPGPSKDPGEGGAEAGMFCFRCRNQVEAAKVARVMELDPSTGERVLVPACPHCGYRALAEEEIAEKGPAVKSPSPASSSLASSFVPAAGSSPDPRSGSALVRNSASSSASSSLVRVRCDWIHFDRKDFSEFDHQIKRHFALHILTSETEECELHIKCHGTPYNRAELYECIVLFTNRKYYFFRWKFHESQSVAKCLTMQDKIDLHNLTRVRPGPCFQWLSLEFKNAKRTLLYTGDPVSSERFVRQLDAAGILQPHVLELTAESSQREAFCSGPLSQVKTEDAEQLLSSLGLVEPEDDTLQTTLWVGRCPPSSKYQSASTVPLANIGLWVNRDAVKDWTLFVLSGSRLLTFDLEYQPGWECPKPRHNRTMNVVNISTVKRGRDGLTLTCQFFRNKDAFGHDEVPKSLIVVMEDELGMTHFFTTLQTQWEHHYGVPLSMK